MICIIVIEVLIVFVILTINDNWYLFEFQTLSMSSCFSRTQINITKWFAPIMIEVLIVFIVILIINDELMVDIYSSCKPSVVITVSIHSGSNWSKCLWWPFHIEWHDLLLSARTTVLMVTFILLGCQLDLLIDLFIMSKSECQNISNCRKNNEIF
jgi:hypothetical protein